MEDDIKVGKSILDTGIYLTSNILVAAVPFILLPLLTRYLNPADYGKLALFQVLIGGMSILVGLNIHTLIGRKFYDKISNKELSYYVGASLQLIALICSFLLISFVVFGEVIGETISIDTHWLFYGLIVSSSTAIIQIRLILWQVRKKALSYGVMQIGQSVLNLLATSLLVFYLGLEAEGRIAAQVIAAIAFFLIAIISLKIDKLLFFFFWKPNFFREILEFGVPLIPHSVGIFLLVSIDRFVIVEKIGISEAGLYMVGLQISMVYAIFFDAINKVYMPWLFESLNKKCKQENVIVINKTYFGVCVVSVLALMGYYILSQLVPYLVGPEFFVVSEFLVWLVLGQFFSGLYLLMSAYIIYSKRTFFLSVITIVSGVLNFFLLIFLCGKLGIRGAAISFCTTMLLRLVMAFIMANRVHPMPWALFVREKS
ncbi:lipopolysaccharide biosynthesis protein [Vibrio navarrensis]|uniref:lipopolysaccharide biosynthesis protein n=1 Tax=Vibrio navarrensis TaxID=29495 RepID=UPI0018696862|nr:oligosaccharide flippase family protein [Vibrio navarrensis]